MAVEVKHQTQASDPQTPLLDHTDWNAAHVVDLTGPALLGRVAATQGAAAEIAPAHSLTLDSTGLRLSGDAASPGAGKYYGTDGSGARGWQTFAHTHHIDTDTTGSLPPARLAQGGASTDQVLAWSGSAWAPANAVPTWTGANTALVRNNANNGYEARARKSSVSIFLPADGNVGQADPGGQLFIWPNVPTTLSAVRARTLGGTCNIQVFRNGTAINGFSSAVALTTSVTSTTSTEAFSQDDRVSVAITGASSLTGVFITFIGLETGA